MYSGSFSLEDRLARLLSRSHRGLPVEKIRTNLQTTGSLHKKSEIVRALNELRKGGVVQLGADRRWKLRRTEAPDGHHADHAGPGEMSDFIHAIRSVVRPGRIEEKTAELPKGKLEPNLKLLPNLLSYYQACLRISGGGKPIETLANAGKKFLLLAPEAPWWPNERKGSRLFIPLNKLSTEFQERLAKANRGKILIGYPNLLITPADPENSPFLKPVATFRCAFVFDEKGVEIDLPAGSLSLNPDWLKEHCKYFNWSVNDLRSWLLFEDTNSMLAEEDGQDGNPSVSVDLKSFVSRLAAATGVGVQGQLDPRALSHRIPVRPENGIYNILSLCCEESGKFVGSSIADYDRLLKAPQNSFKKSVIGPIFGETAPRQVRLPVCSPLPIGESQLLSARSALEGPITVVTGPPGTGKSQVIAAMIFSAVAEGKSVLFAARQHRALDAVQERLNELTGERRLMVRANDSDQSNSFNLLRVIFPAACGVLWRDERVYTQES